METKHTPTPWYEGQVNGNSIIYDGTILNRHLFISSNGGVPEDEDRANAAFIVKAVNCHDYLVDALTKIHDSLEVGDLDLSDLANLQNIALTAIHKAGAE